MKISRQQIRLFSTYLIAGGFNTLICLTVMYLGAKIGLNYQLYTLAGYLIAILSSFFINLRYTFKVNGQILKRLSLFFLISFVNLILVEMIESILIELFDIPQVLAILLGISWYSFTGFFLNNKFVYCSNTRYCYE